MSRMPSLLAAVIVAAGCTAPPASPPLPAGEIVDLSHAYDENTIFWPTSERFRLETVADGVTAGGYYFETHRVLAARNVPIFENLTALERLPAHGAWVVALPMKITGGSGGPLRAIAILP